MIGRLALLSVLLSSACAGSGELDPAATRVPVKETRLYVRDVGAGAPLIVPGAAWLGLDLGPLEASFRLIAYDPRGRGRSASVAAETLLGLGGDVEDLEELRRSLDLDRISLLGWAYNGGLAVRYALAHPEHTDRLVLVAPLSPRRMPYYEQTGERFRMRADPQRFQDVQQMRTSGAKERDPGAYCRAVTAAFLVTYAADERTGASIRERMRSNPCVLPNLDPDVSAQLGQAAVQALGNWDWRPELARLDVPVLLVHGTHDIVPIESSREYVLVLPDARILELEGVGHFPWLEAPDRFFPPVIAFLNSEL